jgi:hypothetical protein
MALLGRDFGQATLDGVFAGILRAGVFSVGSYKNGNPPKWIHKGIGAA